MKEKPWYCRELLAFGEDEKSKVTGTIGAGASSSIVFRPAQDETAFIIFGLTFFNTAPDVFRLTVQHRFIHVSLYDIGEDFIQDGFWFNRLIIVTREFPLELTFENPTPNAEALGYTYHYLRGDRKTALSLARKYLSELREATRE